jgi:hypothetical protein
MPPLPWNLFAILADESNPVRIIPLNEALQAEIRHDFEDQLYRLLADDPEEVAFEPGHQPEEGEIAYLSDFALPRTISDALRNPVESSRMVVNEGQLNKVKGFFTGDRAGSQVLLQTFDRRRLLSSRWLTILYSGGTFQRLQTLGLTLDTKLAAALIDGRLYFQSFAAAHRLLDLGAIFREATDEEVVAFSLHPAIQATDPALLMQHADSWVRRRFTLIRQSGLLDIRGVQERLVNIGARYTIAISFDRTGRLVVPTEKKAFKQIVRLLSDDFYTSEISGTSFLSNSKRRLSARAAARR